MAQRLGSSTCLAGLGHPDRVASDGPSGAPPDASPDVSPDVSAQTVHPSSAGAPHAGDLVRTSASRSISQAKGSARAGKPLSLKARALRLLSTREHSRQELARKLAPHAETSQALEAVLDDLQARGWQSQERFAQSVMHRKASRFGAARLRSELQQHRLSAELTQPLLQALQASEWQRAQALWQQRFGQVASDPKDRLKQMRFLAGRGFAAEVIRKVVAGRDASCAGRSGDEDGQALSDHRDDQDDQDAWDETLGDATEAWDEGA